MRQAITNWPSATPGSDSSAGRLEHVFSNCQSELLGMLFCQLGNLDQARETLQDTYVVCWRHHADAGEAENPRSWVFQTAYDLGRNKRALAGPCPLPANTAVEPRAAEGDSRNRSRRVAIAALRVAIGKLPPEEQEVFLLRQNGQATYQQIAESLGIPLNAVQIRMRLALMKLRKTLETI